MATAVTEQTTKRGYRYIVRDKSVLPSRLFVRVTDDLAAKLWALGESLGLPQSTCHRWALELGIEALERRNRDGWPSDGPARGGGIGSSEAPLHTGKTSARVAQTDTES